MRASPPCTYDRVERTVPPTFAEKLDIVDLQIQHAFRPRADHSLVWGAEYRYAMDDVANSPFIAFLPARIDQAWASLFAQDEITLGPALRLTLGARVEQQRLHRLRVPAQHQVGVEAEREPAAVGRRLAHGASTFAARP